MKESEPGQSRRDRKGARGFLRTLLSFGGESRTASKEPPSPPRDERTATPPAAVSEAPRRPRATTRQRRRVATATAMGEPSREPAPRSSAKRRRRRGGRRRSSQAPQAQGPEARTQQAQAPQAQTQAAPQHAPVQIDADDGYVHQFGEMELTGPVAHSVSEMGYEDPSAIQSQAIPELRAGRDLVGQAITGSGKTAAFGIPICERIEVGARRVQAIVLVPTRELAMQVAREIERIGARRGVQVCPVFGGQPIKRQLTRLARGVDIVVGTPGRVMDHMNRRTLDLSAVKFAVLDEADEMLDIGFARDVEYILRHTPRSRQTMLFSATIPVFVRRLIHRYQNDPVWVRIGAEIQTVDEVDQIYYEVAERDKETAMREVLDALDDGARLLVFRRMQVGVERLVRSLRRDYPVMGLHGGMSQSERDAAMGRFREGSLPILVSTNVAARGIDVPEITHVVNYDMPDNVEEYVHRIGRTARMGRKGTAVSFLAEWDLEIFDKIVEHVGDSRLARHRLSIYS